MAIGLVGASALADAAAGATVTCGGQPATILGTVGKDTLLGTPGPDVIVGFKGSDTVSGLGGEDIICPDEPDGGTPEAGNDSVDAGAGSDLVLASSGADTLDGGGSAEGGFDVIEGGSGNDNIRDVGDGDAHVNTGEGTDRVSVEVAGEVNLVGGGNARVTVVAGGDLNISLHGSANRVTAAVDGDVNASSEGPTVLEAGEFTELNFNGSPGSDTVATRGLSEGAVNLSLGAGDDRFVGDPGSADGFVNVDGGPGDDTIRVPAAEAALGEVAVRGGPGDDRLGGSSGRANYLLGEEGDDSVKGGSGQDFLLGDEGRDALNGGEGPDGYVGGSGDDTIGARDAETDLFFECGEGRDTVRADVVEDQAVNRSGCAESRFAIEIEGQAFTTLLPATSVATYTWTPGAPAAHVWLTAASDSRLTRRLAQQPDLPITAIPEDGTPIVAIDPASDFQTIEGFGGAMTQAAASLLASEGAGRRAQMLNSLFSSSGARLNYVRVPIGATDLSTDVYDYDPLPAGQVSDYDLEHFTVAHDEADLIPALQQAKARNPGLKLMAAPWSAPGWMKIGERFIPDDCGGSLPYLKPEAYSTYAHYFLKFLQAYRERGLPVSMVSLQNEPHHCSTHYPTMKMEPQDQADLAGLLRPLLDANGFASTGILAWDHNWSEKDSFGNRFATTYPQEAVGLAGGTISAVGYHCYESDPAGPGVQSYFHQLFPDVDVYFTECSGFYDKPNVAQNLVNEVRDDLIGPMRNWARTSLYWSLVQETGGRPFLPTLSPEGGCLTCRGMLSIDPDTRRWTRSEDYYYWAQFSKFVDRGATRIESTHRPDPAVETVAFRNPDGSIVVVALNTSSG